MDDISKTQHYQQNNQEISTFDTKKLFFFVDTWALSPVSLQILVTEVRLQQS